MPICLKYHPQTTPQQQSAIIDQGAFPPNSISNIYPTKMRFFLQIFSGFVWQLHGAHPVLPPLAMSYEQWTRVFKTQRWRYSLLACNHPPLSPIIQFAKLLRLQIFNYSKDSIPMRRGATKDVKMTRLAPQNWPLPFNLGGDRSETDFQWRPIWDRFSAFCAAERSN